MQLIIKCFVLVLFFVYTFEFNFSIFKITNNSEHFCLLHYWVFLLGYYLYVYMSYLKRSMLSYFLRISIKICSVFMRAIGFLGGSGLFRTVMFQALDFLFFLMLFSLLVDLSSLHLLEQCRSIYFEFMQLHRCFGH